MMRMLICGRALLVVSLLGGRALAAEQVVVYTSEDQVFSEPILNAFEAKTGITVKAVYDTEETKSTGAVNRLTEHGCQGGGNLVLAKGVLLVAQAKHLTAIGELATLRKRQLDEVAQRKTDPRAQLELGLVAEVLPRPDLLPRAWALAEQLAQQSPLILRYSRVLLTQSIKRQMHELLGYGLALEGLGSADDRMAGR